MDLRKNQYNKLHNNSLIEAELGCLPTDRQYQAVTGNIIFTA